MTVPDATMPTVPDGTLGSTMTINLPRNSGNFTHELRCNFYQSSITVASGAGTSQSWTPGYDLAKQIPNLTYGTATLVCTTKNGSAVVGTTQRTFRLTVPENDTTRPCIQSVALSVISSLEGDLAGLYIRGRTGLKAQITASSPYSTIAAYQVSAGDVSAKGNPATITYLVNDGQVTVEAKVTDARGFSRTHSQKIQVLSYSRPKIVPYTGYAEVICERALEDGQLNSSGTYLAIKAGKSFSSFQVDGKERNSCSLRYRFKVSSAPEYGAWMVLLDSTSAEKEIQVLVRDVVPSTSRSYDIEISAIDALGGEHILRFAIMTSAISFVLYDGVDGAGFGKYPEEPHVVDIAAHMTLKVRGKLEVLGAKWTSLGLNTGVAESPFAYGRQEDTGCYYQLSNGNHIHVACNCSFNYRGTPVAINATQLPAEHRPATTKIINQWSAKVVTGVAYGDIKEAYLSGQLSKRQAVDMYVRFGGMERQRAREKVEVWEFVKRYPECEGITYPAIEAYREFGSGMSAKTFYDIWKYESSVSADVDANGEAISGSKKRKVLDYINRQNLTVSQKDGLYYAFGWAESKINEAPWH